MAVRHAAAAEPDNTLAILRQLVCRSGADVNAIERRSGYTVLHTAVNDSNEKLVKFLLDECPTVDLEAKSYMRQTAYQVAVVTRNEVS